MTCPTTRIEAGGIEMKPWISELEAYALAVIGVVADQLSTRLGLSDARIYESNPNSLWLMQRGLWAPFDVALLAASIAVSVAIMRRWSFPGRWVILLYFVLYFVMRFGAAISNLLLWFLV